MAELVVEFLKTIDAGQLLAMGLIGWFFYSRLGKKFDDGLKDISKKIEKLDEKIIDIDKRLVAVETLLHMKDCCMLKEEKHHKKAI